MADLPRKSLSRLRREPGLPKPPGALTTLLRLYIEERDRGALDAFFEIVYDEYPKIFEGQIRRAGKASDVTVKEVIDESLAKLLTDVVQDRYRKAPESARRHLKFMLRRRLIDRRRYWDRPHEDVRTYRDSIADPQMKSPAAEAELRDREAVLKARLEEALSSLSDQNAKLIRLRLAGRSHGEMAEELGYSPDSIRKAFTRAVEQLMAKLVSKAPTLVMRFQELREQSSTRPRETAWPTKDELREATGSLTERVRAAITRRHLDGASREHLLKEFGAQPLEALLRRGYDLLETRFKVSFPEAFERALS